MQFLKKEVEGEQRISLARSGFKLFGAGQRKEKCIKEEISVPTAQDLFSGEKRPARQNEILCLFCSKRHESKDCFSAPKMTLSQKNAIVKEKRGCFSCLKVGHRSKQCKSKVVCLICSKKHWAVMCPELGPKIEAHETPSTFEEGNVTLSNFCNRDEVYLQTLLVNITSHGQKRTVRALIDTGSQRSYVLKATAEKTGKPIGREILVHSLFGGVTSKQEVHNCYRLRISSIDEGYSCQVKLLDQSKICGPIASLQPGPWIEEMNLKNIKFSDIGCRDLKIEILIGADIAGTLLTGRIEKLQNGLVAVESLLGWTIMGKIDYCKLNTTGLSSIVTSMLIHNSNLEDLWKLETLGISDPKESKTDAELEEAVWDHFHKTLQVTNGRYEVNLPWTNERDNLPDNREVAEKRLLSTTKKLMLKNKFESYNAVFEEWLADGIIEEVTEREPYTATHYLPHRPIFKENSTTSTRPVFDASCRQKDFFSLNDCLAKGQNLIEHIPGLLLEFRRGRIGIISDIRKAFLQISVQKSDRAFLRFLWWKDSEQKVIKEYQHCRVVFGLTCSPFLLGAVINSHLEQCDHSLREVSEKLKSSFYADNCVTSVDSSEEAHDFISKATQVMARGNFDLRGWEKTEQSLIKTESSEKPSKVLGLLWDKLEDTLFCDIPNTNLSDLLVTRRNVLSIAQQVFDPIGYSSPFTLLPKLFLQRSWKSKTGWDAELPNDVKLEFMKWVKELPLLSSVRVPRQATLTHAESSSLHTFVDASQGSYAAAIYLRSQVKDEVKVALLQARARVAPLKKISIPRLELLACLIGARLASFVKNHLKVRISKEYYWTDSSTALFWIKNVEAWGIFVANRVSEIRTLTDAKNWHHVPGTHNPADLPSRGCSIKKLVESRWWEGPQWLTLPREEWPKSTPEDAKQDIDNERRKEVITALNNVEDVSARLFDYFSNYNKILRMVGWMYRFIQNARSTDERRVHGELTVPEITSAEKIIMKLIQQEVFGLEDIKKLKSIAVFKDDEGLLRVKTKLSERKDEHDFISPILLPSKHKLVYCLIYQEHLKMSHAGIGVLMSKLRQTFWILKSRKTIRKVISKCVRCKRYEAKRLESTPVVLPENRVRDASVFEVTGVDLAGPLTLKDQRKAWIILFSCAVYRAIHVELIMSLSTQSFLLGFRRFIARRGRPKVIYSDNGTNFVGADNLLKTVDWKTIEMEATVNRIQWNFNPPAAPWWGGFWERMIQMVKKLLRRVLGQSSLTYEELTTVLYDCEAVVNSRPLTYVAEDTGDFIPLTPAMFLGENLEVGVPDLDSLDQVNLGKRYRRQQDIRNTLRKRFRSEYLSQLVQRPSKVKNLREVNVGDVVLIEDEGKRRISWPMAKVIDIYPGRDGRIRVVRLKTTSGEIVRPIRRVFPLEISCPVEYFPADDDDNRVSKTKTSTDPPVKTVVTRSGRTVKIPSRLLD